MRQRWSIMGILLLVMVVGLGACARSAEVRESPATATPVGSEVPGQGTIVAPGETVVSAVTPVPQTPVAGPTDTPGAGVQETPGTGEQATLVPTSEPVTTATPPPTQPPPAGGQGEAIYHIVQPGETLSSIARRYGTTWQAIAQANGITNPNSIYAGQRLLIPASGGSSGGTSGCRIRHTVRAGEWVWQIARDYGVSPYDILAASGLTVQTGRIVHPGQVLCIP